MGWVLGTLAALVLVAVLAVGGGAAYVWTKYLKDTPQLPSREALQAKLVQAAAQPDQPEVHVRPNKLVEYKYVAEVLAESQRLGVTKLGMVGNEQFIK